MKKFLVIALSLFLVAGLLVGCGGKEEPANTDEPTNTEEPAKEPKNDEPKEDVNLGELEDGIYFAQEDGFAEKSGWKYVVTLEVKDGKIVDAEWNGAHVDGGTDKITRSESGEYGMNGEQGEWHEQAARAEEYLLETQDPTAITYTDDEGHTDAISGASIHVVEFFDLAEKALANGPVGRGQYKDGNYRAEEDVFSNGWKYYADLTVINGYIVAADWDGIAEEGEDTKDVVSANGEYKMNGSQGEWYEQAARAEAYLLETQDPTAITYTDDEGHTDAISGASIHVKEFFVLAEEALANAK